MFDNNNNSSSSNDDNIKEALIEATDQDFLQNSLFNNDKSKPNLNGSTGTNIKPSSRLSSEKIENFEIFGVSQSYKEFVAKKLYKLLKRNIELTKVIDVKKIRKKNKLRGIRLLLSSSDILTGHIEVVPIGAFPGNKIVHEDSAFEMQKCQEVAVNPESIIAKTETELWNERQTGMMFKYKKMPDGTLIEQT